MTNTLSNVELPRRHAVSERGFLAVSALLFIASTTATVAWCNAMQAMTEMPMAWMPMCGQTWWSFGASFTGMWTVMMVAMMLPSLLPMLRRYRVALHLVGKPDVDAHTALAGTAYFALGDRVVRFSLLNGTPRKVRTPQGSVVGNAHPG